MEGASILHLIVYHTLYTGGEDVFPSLASHFWPQFIHYYTSAYDHLTAKLTAYWPFGKFIGQLEMLKKMGLRSQQLGGLKTLAPHTSSEKWAGPKK